MYYSRMELERMCFKALGKNVLIDTRTQIDNPSGISIGNDVRIGSFVILSGKITIGNYCVIGAFSCLYGEAGIILHDFVTLSGQTRLLTSSSDYSGESMSSSMVPDEYQNILYGEISVGKHSIIGNGSLVLPGVCIEEGVTVGAMSMVKNNADSWGIYAGVPAKRIKERSRRILQLEKKFLRDNTNYENFNH